MKMTYVIGHKKPDTDSVCASISYSYLKNKLGWTTEPRVLGNINKETKFVLDYFKVEEPHYLNDVKVQIKNMSYLKDAYINEHTSIAKTFEELQKLGVTGLPLVDENNKLKGYINVKEMAKNIIEGDIYELNTSYANILEVLNGKEILKFDDEIKGELLIASYRSTTFISNVKLTPNDILIVGDRHSLLEYAVNSAVKLIILTNDCYIKWNHIIYCQYNIRYNYNC